MNRRFSVETADGPLSRTARAVAMAGLLAVFGASGPAQALQVRTGGQSDLARNPNLSRPARAQPPSGLYVSESGERFVFDRSGSRPLFRFESRNETWALRPTPAPRGDTIYRNDAGDQILRVTPDGGMTLYSVRAPSGSPASVSGPAPALTGPLMGPIALANLMVQRSALLSRALGRTIVVQLDGEQDEGLCVDALLVTTDAVLRMTTSATLRARLSDLRTVTIIEGRASGVTFRNGDLRVTVRPGIGLTGRPSSAVIIRTVSVE